MPNRIIKESICTSDSIDTLSWFEEVLFYRLIVNCDDYGRFDGRPAVIKSRLFPLKESLTTQSISKAVDKLAIAGMVVLYAFEGKPYLYLPTWNDHQSVRAKRSRFPAPDENVKASASMCKQMYADVPVIQSESESNPNPIRESVREAHTGTDHLREPTKKVSAQHFAPPTVEEVAAYCRDRGNAVDAERFCDFYAAKGWMIGKEPMKDWRAAVRTWEKRDAAEKAPKAAKKPQSFDTDEFFAKALNKSYGD